LYQTFTPSNIQFPFRRCGIYSFDPTVINDSIVAPPSTAFIRKTKSLIQLNEARSKQNQSAKYFLQEREGKILQNVRTAQIRNTLSKVVGVKAIIITEDTVTEKIKEHINKQANKNSTPKLEKIRISVQQFNKACITQIRRQKTNLKSRPHILNVNKQYSSEEYWYHPTRK
jgi:hypothetical protein